MKRSSFRVAVRVSSAFAVAFIVAAIAIFGVVYMAGVAIGVDELSLQWRLGIAAASLAALALCDLIAIRRRNYCPLSWRRQTPQSLRFRYSVTVTAALWGFDTGLAVTTFRVTALTWAALLLTFLGLGSWRIAFAYALAFAIPIVVIFNGQPVESRSSTSLARLLDKRVMFQGISAITLLTGTTLLVVSLVQ